MQVGTLLRTLHASDRVHRDIKPGNVLLIMHNSTWRLIDYGIVAPAGAPFPVSVSVLLGA